MVERKKWVKLRLCILTGLAVMILGSCSSLRGLYAPGEDAARKENVAELAMAGPEEAEEKPELPPFRNDYNREDFIRALVQLDVIRESGEYFDQYMWGDQLFEDSLASITWLAGDPLLVGRGVELVVYDDLGGEYLRVRRGWIREGIRNGSGAQAERGGRAAQPDLWWKMIWRKPGEREFVCETLVDEAGVPQLLRVKDLASGETMKRPTFYTTMLEGGNSESSGGIAEAGDGGGNWFRNIREDEYRAGITPLYAGMEIVGEEVVMVGGRWVRAVRMESAPVPEGSVLEAWFSPDVSGRLLRIALRDGRTIAEVTAFIEIGLELSDP